VSGHRANDLDSNAPATLYRVMRMMIGEGLKARYQVPREMPHELFVLLMQLNEQKRKIHPPYVSGSQSVHRRKSK
jgi:hypothetical protein